MTSATKQIPWLRVLVEGVVIVGSILLAFGIQALWDQRVERQVELELLASILESVEAGEAGLNAALDRMSDDESRSSRFFNASASELASFQRDSVGGVFASLFRSNSFDVLRGPLPGVLNTAQAGLIREPSVRAALNQWLAVATELDQYNQQAERIGEAGSMALGRHDVFRRLWLAGIDELAPTVDLNPIRNDAEVMAIAASRAQRRYIQRLFAEPLLRSLDTLRQLLLPLVD